MGEGEASARRAVSGVVRFVLGPWPFFPWVMFAIGFAFWLFQNMQVSLFGQYDSCRFICVELPPQLTTSGRKIASTTAFEMSAS